MQSRVSGALQKRNAGLSALVAFPALVTRFDPVEKVRHLCLRLQQSPEGFRLEKLLDEMRVSLRADESDRSRIPASGPVVVVANHPHGILDGALLMRLLTRVRPDVKVLSNFLFLDIPELTRHFIFLDSFETDRSVESTRRALREALAWLQDGGMLGVFPAVGSLRFQMPGPHGGNPHWSDLAIRLLRRAQAAALPVYFCGNNMLGQQLLGMVHPKLRPAFQLQQFLQHEGKTIEARVGSTISYESLAATGPQEATEYLRWRTYLLGRRKHHADTWPVVLRSRLTAKLQKPLALAGDSAALAKEIQNLPAESCLIENGAFAVYLASACQVPLLLREVGRLRELTFRQGGEGTGKGLDLDQFDQYYWHLLLWNRARQELVGAYRAGSTAEILSAHGISGLYTSTLFRYERMMFEKLGPALELGRSFVRPEYQRQYVPLMLLWKGIARLIAMHPEISVLFGAVSISNDYSQASRQLIYGFFETRMQSDELASLVEPRNPFRAGLLQRWDCRAMTRVLRELDQLSQPITDLEFDGKGLPILLRQYAKLGGKLLGFNLDRKFSNCLDGLILVDLRKTEPAVLERYMGKEAAARFRQACANR
jgi:putative hemolysin